jgi:spore coat protein U-like protein
MEEKMKSVKFMMILVSMVIAGAAMAQSANVDVEATVTAVCSIATPGTLDFGTYDATAAAPDSASVDIVVTCSRGTTPLLSITDGGETMIGPDDEELTYSAEIGEVESDDTEHTFPLDGTIGTGQFVKAGAYSDTIEVTVTF